MTDTNARLTPQPLGNRNPEQFRGLSTPFALAESFRSHTPVGFDIGIPRDGLAFDMYAPHSLAYVLAFAPLIRSQERAWYWFLASAHSTDSSSESSPTASHANASRRNATRSTQRSASH
jgi:hypothetical protein